MDSFSRRWPINTKRILSWGLMIVIGRESTMLLFILFLGKISTLGMKNKFWSRLENTFQLANLEGFLNLFQPVLAFIARLILARRVKFFTHMYRSVHVSEKLIRRCRLLGAE